ncbi:hypothetical protein J6590_009368 [Homalodisca vitripennis]|nr:hypothetical protein J6590_009368 [Homalodisca vitripennis]
MVLWCDSCGYTRIEKRSLFMTLENNLQYELPAEEEWLLWNMRSRLFQLSQQEHLRQEDTGIKFAVRYQFQASWYCVVALFNSVEISSGLTSQRHFTSTVGVMRDQAIYIPNHVRELDELKLVDALNTTPMLHRILFVINKQMRYICYPRLRGYQLDLISISCIGHCCVTQDVTWWDPPIPGRARVAIAETLTRLRCSFVN